METNRPRNKLGLRERWTELKETKRIVETTSSSPAVNLTYDPVDNRLSVTEVDGSQTSWTYDPNYQLINEARSTPGALDWDDFTLAQWQSFTLTQWQDFKLDSSTGVYNTTYTYDAVGNRLVQNASGALTTSSYDAANRLTSSQDVSGTTTYTNSPDGACVQETGPSSTTYYEYDEDTRMILAEPVAGSVTFVYNADGQRTEKISPSATTNFMYDFMRLLETSDASGDLGTEYTYLNNGFGDLVSEYGDAATAYHQYDGLGSTDALLNDAAAATDRYNYTAFGIESQTGSSDSPYTFVGQQGYYLDSEIELYYLGMGGGPPAGRPYDPVKGRFLSKDPTGLAAGDINEYRYLNNNPVAATDPSGHCPPAIPAAGAVVAGGLATVSEGVAAAGAAVGSGIAVAAPPLAVAAVGGVAIYGSYKFSKNYIAPTVDNATFAMLQAASAAAAALEGLSFAKKNDIKQIDRIANEVGGLTNAQREILHEWITKQNLSLEEIKELAELVKELYPNK